MFTDNLYEFTWEDRAHRGWTTLASFAVQMMGVALLLLLPMIYTQRLPQLTVLASTLSVPVPPLAPVRTEMVARTHIGPVSNYRDGRLMRPDRVPGDVRIIDDRDVPPVDAESFSVLGSTGTGRPDGVIGSILSDAARSVAPPRPAPVAHPVHVSRMMQGNLVHRVEPVYPPLARAAQIQGPVLLQAIISKQGTIESLHAVSGHPLLVQAAVAAVQQWRYRPYELNGEPVEVETQVTVNFVLSGG